MPEDLSYLLSKPTPEEEEKVRAAVEAECIKAISVYLDEVATTMEINSIECLNPVTIRAMFEEMQNRLTQNAENN